MTKPKKLTWWEK
jgi:hypothetical protein